MAGTKSLFMFTIVCVVMAVVSGQETCSRYDPDRSVKDSTELLEVLIEEIKQMNEAQRSTCQNQRMMANIPAAISEIRRDLESAAEVSRKQNRDMTSYMTTVEDRDQRMMANISAAIEKSVNEIRRDLESAEVSRKQNRDMTLNVTIALEKMKNQHTTEIQALKDQILRLTTGL